MLAVTVYACLTTLGQHTCPNDTIEVTIRSQRHVSNISRDVCRYGPRWDNNRPYLAVGQNLEDAIIYQRFFKNGPLKQYRRDGVFVEMGALDGVIFSNTILLEHCVAWSGLLVEPHPVNYALLTKNRPCTPKFHGGACPSGQLTMYMSDLSGSTATVVNHSRHVVPCKPMSSILYEHGIDHIQFFSLDVEGAELDVLQTIDWDRTKIDVLIVECNARNEEVRAYLKEIGMIRVPSKVECTSWKHSPCHRNEQILKPMYLSISKSDVYVGNKDIEHYDQSPTLWQP